MNRKTATILCAAGGLAAVAAILGARESRSTTTKTDPIRIPVDTPATLCGAPAPSRATADFGAGSLVAALSGQKTLRGGDGELFVAVDVVAREAEIASRPPMSVAIVIDHSGSMQGEKIARARDAARGLVSRLGER